MAIFKRCPNCHDLYQGKYCKACANRLSKKRQNKNEALKLYGSGTWRKCRKNIRIKYHDLDIWLLAIGVTRRCEEVHVHHILERDERPDLVYDIDNLITVGRESHAEIHEWYNKRKSEALMRIARGKKIFEEIYGDDG